MRPTAVVLALLAPAGLLAQASPNTTTGGAGTRLLRQPTVSATQIAFAYAGDIWALKELDANPVKLLPEPAPPVRVKRP